MNLLAVDEFKALKSHNKDRANYVANEVYKRYWLKNFFSFAQDFLGYKDLDKNVHAEFIKVFESRSPRKLVVMPRGTFKSTLGSVAYPIWRLLRDPNLTILLDSELYSNSKNLLREIKTHFESEKMARFFGDQIGSKWDEGEIIIKSRTKNIKEASITVGGLGTTKVGQHFSIIVADDMNSPQNSETVEKCQKVIDHFRYNLAILNPDGEYIVIGTRYAERDLVGYLLGDVLEEKHLAGGKLKRLTEAERLQLEPPMLEHKDA